MLLPDLIKKIETTAFSELKHILEQYKSYDWENHIIYDEHRYFRNKIFSNEDVEIFIIAWLPNQKATIHDHSENGCWLKVLRGNLQEKIYDKNLKTLETNILKTNDISFMKNNLGFHSIENLSEETAISLHIYSPPNHKTMFF